MGYWLEDIAIFLLAAVVAVPLAQRLGLGSVLGYLAAGVVIGPWGFGVITDVENILHLGEFGVVLLLFVIGLEMQPRRLWLLRRSIMVLGGLQVTLSTVALTLAGILLGFSTQAAFLGGLALSLSSTAFAIQLLAERGELTSRHGRAAFGVLLFQDLAVIPILALLPLLAVGREAVSLGGTILETAKVALILGTMVIGGHYVLRPVFRIVAATRMPEIFTAWALLVVVGTAVVMEAAGVSVALGAFAAGVLLADSEYRHELEANIDPFKDLLLGLFFIAVGMSINLGLLVDSPLWLLSLALGVLIIKGGVLYGLGRRNGLSPPHARALAASLPQGGEFAFVIFTAALALGLLEQGLVDELIAVVTLTMAVTPLLAVSVARFNQRREASQAEVRSFDDPAEEPQHPVIIAGFGRMGQIVARILRAKRIGFVALENSTAQVDFVRKYGDKVYYGDATRLELLRVAGAADARIFVLAIEHVGESLEVAQVVRRNFPHLKVYARARNREHAYKLMTLGIEDIQRETFHSSLAMAQGVLRGLGLPSSDAQRAIDTFRKFDEERLHAHHHLANDQAQMERLAKEAVEELEDMFEADSQAGLDDAKD